MKKLKDVVTESPFKVGNNIIKTVIFGITITANNQDTFDKSKIGHNLGISLSSIERFDMLWKLSDKIRDLFMKHFRQIYDRPKISIENKRRLTVTSPGTLGGINWLFPRFKRFISDLEVLIKEQIKTQDKNSENIKKLQKNKQSIDKYFKLY